MISSTQKEIDDFIFGYKKLCEQHNAYLVLDGVAWLQGAGEQIDIDEAVSELKHTMTEYA